MMTMIPCTNSAAVNGAAMPTALKPNQNARAFMSQCAMAHPNVARKREGSRTTARRDPGRKDPS